jgi:hypothetical protein
MEQEPGGSPAQGGDPDLDQEEVGEDPVEEADEESFPASDAPSRWSG